MFNIPQNPFAMMQPQKQAGLPEPLMQMLMLAMQGGAGAGGFAPGQPPAGVMPQVPQVMPAPVPVQPQMLPPQKMGMAPMGGQLPPGLDMLQELGRSIPSMAGWGGGVPGGGADFGVPGAVGQPGPMGSRTPLPTQAVSPYGKMGF